MISRRLEYLQEQAAMEADADAMVATLDAYKGLWLEPLFPIGPFTPQSKCGHKIPIKPGSSFCCMVCHKSGHDDHPAMERNPKTDPRPEPKEPRKAAV